MSYEILFLLACTALPLCTVLGYRQGRRDAGAPPESGSSPNHVPAAARTAEAAEDTRYSRMISNIDSYDGTERGQQSLE